MSDAHFDLASFPAAETIKMLTKILVKITRTNDRLCSTSDGDMSRPHEQSTMYTCFHARSIPTIDIHSYLSRILKYTPCSNEVFLSLLVYFDRMSRNDSNLRIDSFNIHRLIIAGVTVASKFFSDVFFTNCRYAKVGGLPSAELNTLELEFLHLNNFNLSVSIEELQQYGDQLLNHCLREENLKRQAKSDSPSISHTSKTISSQPRKIEEVPPDINSQHSSNETENVSGDKKRLSKSNTISPNESEGSSRPPNISNNTDTSPKWANGRYNNSMRVPLNVDTKSNRRNSNENDSRTPYHRMSGSKFQQSTPNFSSPSRKLDALLDASFSSNERKLPSDTDHCLPTPPNSVSPQFQSHQSAIADSISK
ncbi:hypothetical protein NQZ79_g3110 [Umbelopsis isabellina]|nr:hypothetical protein NQZ79_g3110 [Umbelopsis isabellina]